MMAGASTHRVSFILTRQAPVYTIKENGYSWTITYSSYDALCFTVAVGVTLWLWGLIVALIPLGATFDFALCQSAAQKLTGKVVTYGNAISAFLAVQAARAGPPCART